jgi:hypothetical protein
VQGPKASHRLGKKSGAVLLFFAAHFWREKASQTSRVDFVVFFVLFRDSFSFVARRIFSSFPPSFCKTCVFYHTDDKRMGATHKYGCTVGSFCPWGAVSRQLWHRWMSERCSLLRFA